MARAGEPSRHDARTDRLAGLTQADLAILDNYLRAGPVALVEFADDDTDELPAFNLATYIDAPAAVVAEMIADPSGYPKFMPTIDDVTVVAKSGFSTVYDWAWRLAIFKLGGRNTLTVYPPPPDRPSVGFRMTVDSSRGDLGAGRLSARVLPASGNRSLLVLSVRLDLRDSNWVVRQMAKASRTVNRSANIAVACSIVLATKQEAERRAGHIRSATAAHALAKPSIDVRRLAPLLNRGDLVLFDMTGDHLDQLTVISKINHRVSVVRGVMTDAGSFGSALVPGSYAKVVSRGAGTTDFKWGVDMPLVGISGAMRLIDDGSLISVNATSGALRGGSWRFEASALTPRSTLVVGWTSFDLKNSSWLLERLIAADPHLDQGLAAAADVMLVRSLRARSQKRARGGK